MQTPLTVQGQLSLSSSNLNHFKIAYTQGSRLEMMEGICVKKLRFKLSACQLKSTWCSVSLSVVSAHALLSSLAN